MGPVLVLKLGALGDFVHAFHAFAAIRHHHRQERVVLMTTEPYADLGRAAPWFDDVWIDARAPWWRVRSILKTVRAIRRARFVYDLQTSRRSACYFLLARSALWSGIAPGCSHPHANPRRDLMHTIERQREQLQAAGIKEFPFPERSWLIRRGDLRGIAGPFALLVPGGRGVGKVKRWPAANYGGLALHLATAGLRPVVIGAAEDAPLAAEIGARCPDSLDLTGRTSIFDIAALAARSDVVIGNDTGPVHLAASVGAMTLTLFSEAGVPEQAAPRGPHGEWTAVLRRDDLRELRLEEVIAAVERLRA